MTPSPETTECFRHFKGFLDLFRSLSRFVSVLEFSDLLLPISVLIKPWRQMLLGILVGAEDEADIDCFALPFSVTEMTFRFQG